MRPVAREGTAAAVAGVVASAAWQARGAAPGGSARWQRTNHAGLPVSLVEGPAWSAGAVAGILAARGLDPSMRLGAVVATAGAAVLGAVDDLLGSSADKGLRGHLGALAGGRLTTGGAKVLGIGATGLCAAWPLLAGERAARPAPAPALLLDTVVAGALLAGAANLGNLLDLRPGRVLKLVLAAAPLPWPEGDDTAGAGDGARGGRLLRAAAAGAAAALLHPDLDEQAMLGDCGANAAGALLGSALVVGTAAGPRARAARAAALAAVVILTLASERVSFTRVIEATPVLRELDAAGRRPRPA